MPVKADIKVANKRNRSCSVAIQSTEALEKGPEKNQSHQK